MTTDPIKSRNSDLFYDELEPLYEFGKFIDGSDGGFAMAARGFKSSLAARA